MRTLISDCRPSPSLNDKRGRIDLPALARAHPALAREDHGDRLVDHRRLDLGLLRFLDAGAALVAEGLDVFLDLGDHQVFERLAVLEDLVQALLFLLQVLELLLDLDVLELGQLAQAHLEDVLGLPLAELEGLDQVGLGIVRIADDLDHLVHVQQDDHASFEHVDAVQHLVELMPRAARDGGEAELQPLGDDLAQVLAGRPAVQARPSPG